MEACYGGTDVMERSCAVARGIDINSAAWGLIILLMYITAGAPKSKAAAGTAIGLCAAWRNGPPL